ncbi:SEC-C metal-binding domain-containing protein [Sphingosinicella terrae]
MELVEKLGRNDPCPCGSGRSFQALLPRLRPVSTARSAVIIGATDPARP